MSSNYIIECRNKTALLEAPENNNGDWTTNLQEKVNLEDGDTIICRNSFIDTKAFSNSKVIIEKDLTLNLKWIAYKVNLFGARYAPTGAASPPADNPSWATLTNTSSIIPYNNSGDTFIAKNDGDIYICCNKNSTGGLKFVPTLSFNSVYAFQSYGEFTVTIVYTSAEGHTVRQDVNLPGEPNLGAFKQTFKIPLGLVYNPAITPAGQTRPIAVFVKGTTTLMATDNSDNKTATVYKDTQVHALQSTDLPTDNFIPKVFETSIRLPKNNYSPQHICEFINSRLAETGGNPSINNLPDSQFLFPVGGTANQNPTLNNFVAMVDSTNSQELYGYQYNTATDNGARYIGTSQVVLSFKPDTGTFNWEYLHFPTFSDNDEVVGWGRFYNATGQNNNDNPVSSIRKITKNGGIMWTELSSTDDNGNEGHFWDDILGFDTNKFINQGKDVNPNCILAHFTQETQTSDGHDYRVCNTIGSVPIFNPKPERGKQMTAGYQGIDTSVQKGATYFQPMTIPVQPNQLNTATSLSTTQTTDEIDAGKSVVSEVATLPYGYFLVEVKAQFANNYLTTEQNKRDVVAIVSRYYDKDSYTSSSTDSSVVYTHHGSPMMLSSFRCRILDSDKTLATNIGQDNTVFLEVIKAEKNKSK